MSGRSSWCEKLDFAAVCEEVEGVGEPEDPSVDVVTEFAGEAEEAASASAGLHRMLKCIARARRRLMFAQTPRRWKVERKQGVALREFVGPGVSRCGTRGVMGLSGFESCGSAN